VLTPEAIETLQAHDWQGNIRELANAIERATILSGGGPILPEHLPTQVPARRSTATTASRTARPSSMPAAAAACRRTSCSPVRGTSIRGSSRST
jgi:DNA-binding NtrC family response regulator